MSIHAVKRAVHHARHVLRRWDEVGEKYWRDGESWREDQTRYALIDPILRALGWNTCEPEECYTEYPRPLGGGRVDYALFRQPRSLRDIGLAQAEPDVIVEAKSALVEIKGHPKNLQSQLRRYVKAKPAMTREVAVLTNGKEWHLYCIDGEKQLAKEPATTVCIQTGSLRQASETLCRLLMKEQPR